MHKFLFFIIIRNIIILDCNYIVLSVALKYFTINPLLIHISVTLGRLHVQRRGCPGADWLTPTQYSLTFVRDKLSKSIMCTNINPVVTLNQAAAKDFFSFLFPLLLVVPLSVCHNLQPFEMSQRLYTFKVSGNLPQFSMKSIISAGSWIWKQRTKCFDWGQKVKSEIRSIWSLEHPGSGCFFHKVLNIVFCWNLYLFLDFNGFHDKEKEEVRHCWYHSEISCLLKR